MIEKTYLQSQIDHQKISEQKTVQTVQEEMINKNKLAAKQILDRLNNSLEFYSSSQVSSTTIVTRTEKL